MLGLSCDIGKSESDTCIGRIVWHLSLESQTIQRFQFHPIDKRNRSSILIMLFIGASIYKELWPSLSLQVTSLSTGF